MKKDAIENHQAKLTLLQKLKPLTNVTLLVLSVSAFADGNGGAGGGGGTNGLGASLVMYGLVG